MQTVVEVAAEKNSTLVLPFPVELLRFLERATPSASQPNDNDEATAARPDEASNGDTLSLQPARIPDDARGLHLDTPSAGTIQS